MSNKPDLNYQHECPQCGAHRLDIVVSRTVTVQFTSDDDHSIVADDDGSAEWDDDSPATCTNCGFAGTLRLMQPGA